MTNKTKEMAKIWRATEVLINLIGDDKDAKISMFRESFKAFTVEWDSLETEEDKKLLFDYFEKLAIKLI